VRALIFAVLLCPTLLAGSVGARSPFTGKWKLDETKLKPQPNAARTQFLQIDVAASNIAIIHQGVNAKGEPSEWAIHADIDGKLYGVLNSPDMDGVRCWLSDPHTILLKFMRDSATTAWETAEISKNGKTLKVTYTVVDDQGKETKSIAWFDRQ
jgi:hypothetical protein